MVMRFLLDFFTTGTLQKWKKIADSDEEFEVRLYHHLEGLRFSKYEALLDSLRQSKSLTRSLDGWVRIVDFLHSLKPLSPKGSMKQGGRFNIGNDIDRASAKSFPALYIAENHDTAYREKFSAGSQVHASQIFSGHDFALRSPSSYSSIVIKGEIQNVFDLRSHHALSAFIRHIRHFTLSKELIELARSLNIDDRQIITKPKVLLHSFMEVNWRQRPSQYGLPANSQIFGRMLADAGFEGVMYKSTKCDGHCIAVFPGNFQDESSFVELCDPSPEEAIRKLDRTTLNFHLS